MQAWDLISDAIWIISGLPRVSLWCFRSTWKLLKARRHTPKVRPTQATLEATASAFHNG